MFSYTVKAQPHFLLFLFTFHRKYINLEDERIRKSIFFWGGGRVVLEVLISLEERELVS